MSRERYHIDPEYRESTKTRARERKRAAALEFFEPRRAATDPTGTDPDF